jgi:predicted RNase H-like HicB family nuclease
MTYRIRLLETEEGWAVSCLDLPGCHSQGNTREEALSNIREAITLWLEVEAEEAGVKSVRWHEPSQTDLQDDQRRASVPPGLPHDEQL